MLSSNIRLILTQPSSQVLMAELNKIKAEKARDEAEKEAGRREEEEQIRMENILSGCNSASANFSGSYLLNNHAVLPQEILC